MQRLLSLLYLLSAAVAVLAPAICHAQGIDPVAIPGSDMTVAGAASAVVVICSGMIVAHKVWELATGARRKDRAMLANHNELLHGVEGVGVGLVATVKSLEADRHMIKQVLDIVSADHNGDPGDEPTGTGRGQ